MERRGARSPSASFEDEEELVRVQDDLTRMLGVLPEDVRGMVRNHPQRKHLLEICWISDARPRRGFWVISGRCFCVRRR